MAITGVVDGNKGSFVATPFPLGSVVPSGIIPKWTSSDVTIATVTETDPTGLTCIVTGLLVGSITLTVAATLADNTVVQGSAVVPILPGQIKSFIINQTA